MASSEHDPSSPSDRLPAPVRLPGPGALDFIAFSREHPRAAARAFDALAFEERVRIVLEAPLRNRLTLIHLSGAPEAIVQALPSAEVLFTLKDSEDDAPELVRLATTEQVKVFLDLDCWKRDHLDFDSVQEWLALLQEVPEKLGDMTEALDMELLVGFLRARLRVWKAESGGQLPPEAPEGLSSLDGVYYLELLRSNDDLPLVRALLLEARERDETLYLRLLEGVIHEIDLELEAWAFRWRTARLTDEGFPELDDALSVYVRMDPDHFDPMRHRKHDALQPVEPVGPRTGKVLALRTDSGDLLLRRAWEAGTQEGDWETIEEEMLHLLNRVLVADGIEVNSAAPARAVFDRAHATLSLGIETALDRAGASSEEARVRAAVRLLREVRLEGLFQLGFTRTLLVRDLALRAVPEGDERWVMILDPPLPEAVAGARRDRPLLWTGLLGVDKPEHRTFRTLAEVEIARRAMRLVGALRRLWDDLSKIAVPGSLGEGKPRRAPMRLSGLAITAFAWRTLEGTLVLRPFPVARLFALQNALFESHGPACAEPRLREDTRARVRAAFCAWLEGTEQDLRSQCETFLDGCLEQLRTEIGILDPRHADPRFVSAMLLARA